MKFLLTALVLTLLTGCATSGREVNCSWRLRPINAPAAVPKGKPAAGVSQEKRTEKRTEARAQ